MWIQLSILFYPSYFIILKIIGRSFISSLVEIKNNLAISETFKKLSLLPNQNYAFSLN